MQRRISILSMGYVTLKLLIRFSIIGEILTIFARHVSILYTLFIKTLIQPITYFQTIYLSMYFFNIKVKTVSSI